MRSSPKPGQHLHAGKLCDLPEHFAIGILGEKHAA